MNYKKARLLLIYEFTALIFIIIAIAVILNFGLYSQRYKVNDLYNNQISQRYTVLRADVFLVKAHRAMKDVATSSNEDQINSALKDFDNCDLNFKNLMNSIDYSQNPSDYLIKQILQEYENWNPIRQKTIAFAKSGQTDKSVEVTKTLGADQVSKIGSLMDDLVGITSNNANRSFNDYITYTTYFNFSVIILCILAIIIAVLLAKRMVMEQTALQNTLYLEKENLNVTLHSIGDGVVVTDNEQKILMLNEVAEKLTGWTNEQAKGKNFKEVFILSHEDENLTINNPILEVLKTDKICELANHAKLTSKDGTSKFISDSAAPIKNKNGNRQGVILVFRDVTERKKQQDEIKFLSYNDSLTGLNNRAYFQKSLEHMECKEFLPVSVIMGDVNGLKLMNDVYGHAVGDELLVAVANIFKQNSPTNSIVSRWGGDEFTILLPNTTFEQAQIYCDNFKSACKNCEFKKTVVSISLGLATKHNSEEDINKVLREAEDIMYTQKLIEGKSVRSAIISTLQKTLYEKSCETEEHAVRMMQLSTEFAKSLDLTQYETDVLHLLSLLHDLGKIGVSDNILNKKDHLTEDEWAEIKKHPEIGYRIAHSTPELVHISELILSHHERWDGTGYPQSLKGTQIPKIARILSIIDAFDVMTNVRPYKEKMTIEQACQEIKQNSGTQFDPYLAVRFLSCDFLQTLKV